MSPQWLHARIPNHSGVLAAPAPPLRRKLSVLSAFPLTLGLGAYRRTQLRGKRACRDKSSCSGQGCSGLCSSHIPHDLSVWLRGRLLSSVSVSTHDFHRPSAAPRMAQLGWAWHHSAPAWGNASARSFSISGVGTGSSCPSERCLEQSIGGQGVQGGVPASPSPVLHLQQQSRRAPPAGTRRAAAL